MKKLLRAILLSTAVLSAPATIGSASAADTVALKPEDAERALGLTLGNLRLSAGTSFGALWAAGTADFRRAAAALAPKDVAEAALFTDFFAHATETYVIQGARAISAWRDPLTDALIVGDWKRLGAGWTLSRLSMVLAQDLAASEGAIKPLYPNAEVAKAVVVRHAEAMQAFRQAAAQPDALPWGAGDPRVLRARETALARLSAAAASREAMAVLSPDAERQIAVSLIEETPLDPAVSESVGKTLSSLSLETRLSLQAIQFVPGKGEAQAIVQSYFDPSRIFVVHLSSAGLGGAVRVANVEAVDLTKAE